MDFPCLVKVGGLFKPLAIVEGDREAEDREKIRVIHLIQIWDRGLGFEWDRIRLVGL